MTQHRRSRPNEAGARRRWTGNRAWVAAAVGVLGLLTAALVHLFTRPVDPFEPPVLLPPAASAPTEASPPGRTSPPGRQARTSAPESPPPVHPSAPPSETPVAPPSGSPSATAPGNAGLEPDGSTEGDVAVLAHGDQGSDVLDLQRRLRAAGVDTAPVDGVYDQPTEAAVQNYQALRGIRTDPSGVYGPDTRSALERET